MSRIKNILIKLLTEGKLDDMIKKYPEYSEQFSYVSQQKILPKFFEWIAKNLNEGIEVEDLVKAVQDFEKNKQRLSKKDINSYSFDELRAAIDELGVSKTSRKTKLKTKGAETIYSNGPYELIYIKSKDASVCYGAGTIWCITARNESYFESYSNKNILFYFLINKDLDIDYPNYKIAFAVIRKKDNDSKILGIDIYDAKNRQMKKEALTAEEKKALEIAEKHAVGRESSFYGLKFSKGTETDEDIENAFSDLVKGSNATLEEILKTKNVETLEKIYEKSVKLEKSDKDAAENIYTSVILRMIDLKVPESQLIQMVEKYS